MAERPGRGAIAPSPEDAAGRRRPGAAARRRPPEGGGGSRFLSTTVLVVLIGGLAVAGWFIAQQFQMIRAEQQALADARSRIEVLEDRLRVTDEALTERGQSTSEQINFWESEIRKLWAVTNERNRKWIEDNQKAIADLKGSLTQIQSTSRELQGTLGRHESAFKDQQRLIDEINSIQMQIQQVSRSQRDLVDKVNSAQQTVAQLRAGLAGRVEQTEQAVAAIDAYRLQLNSRLADIERRLSNLSGSTSL
jgi:chromosome segregation ATPase